MAQRTDISKMLTGLGDGRDRALAAAKHAVDVFGEQVIGDAQQLTPVKTGALQASGTTEPAQEASGAITKTIGFNTNYAAAVHERLNVHHNNGRAKFLETAMKHDEPKFSDFVATEVKKVL